MNPMLTKWLLPIGLLIASNIFMTYAWYYHLKVRAWPLVTAILVSWGIAFFEYCLQVPANRIGHVSNGGAFSAPQLKIMQEAITLVVFACFSIAVLKERPRVNEYIAMGLIMLAVVVSMMGKRATIPA